MEDVKPEVEQISRTPSPGDVVAGAEDDSSVEVGLRTWLAVFAGCMCVFHGYFVGIMTATYTPTVVRDIGGSTQVTWLPNAYQAVTLALAAFLCRLGDVYGRRNILVIGFGLCAIGCIVIAVAKSMSVVIIGNFYALAAEVLPRRYRGLASTLTAASGGAGAMTCYLVNGAFIRSYGVVGWRYGYYVGAVISLVTAALLWAFYTPIYKTKKTFTQVLVQDVDRVGTGLLIGFAIPFLIGLNWGGNAYPWASVQCIATLAVGGTCLIALIIHQVWIKTDGLFNHELYRCRNFALSQLGLFIEGVTFLVFLLFYPLMTDTLYETRPWNQSLRLLPFWGTFTVVCPLIGVYTRGTKDLKNPLIAGWVALLVSTVVFSTLDVSKGPAAIGVVALAGAGFAAPLALLNASAQLAVPKHLVGLATGQIIAARAFGASVGAVIFVTILTVKSTVLLPAGIAAAAIEAGLPESSVTTLVTGLLTMNSTLTASTPGLNPAILAAAGAGELAAYARSFHFGWYSAIPFVGVGAIIAIALDGPIIKRQMNWIVDDPVEAIHHTDEKTEA